MFYTKPCCRNCWFPCLYKCCDYLLPIPLAFNTSLKKMVTDTKPGPLIKRRLSLLNTSFFIPAYNCSKGTIAESVDLDHGN